MSRHSAILIAIASLGHEIEDERVTIFFDRKKPGNNALDQLARVVEGAAAPAPIDDGGPAFPWGEHGAHLGGMSLRDYFAARAMHAELVTCGVPGEAAEALLETCAACGMEPVDRMAFNAYEMADAMLKARQQ